MKTYFMDINKKGKKIYYIWNQFSQRYQRYSKDIIEYEVITGQAEIEDYIPLKSYEEMTDRQLKAALKNAIKGNSVDGIKLIREVLNNRINIIYKKSSILN